MEILSIEEDIISDNLFSEEEYYSMLEELELELINKGELI